MNSSHNIQSAIKIGTRESQLAVWQATLVKDMLAKHGFSSELVYIRSEGDTDLKTPLYEIGVQGIFTRALDIALLNNQIDIAVHSMKDVPTQMPVGIVSAAVLPRASYKDIFVPREGVAFPDNPAEHAVIATSSVRRKAQWLNRYPAHELCNLRGNVNTRLAKVKESNWAGAIFAAAGLERINLRPSNAVDLDWMLPAPAQGAIMVACRENDTRCLEAAMLIHDADTALCTQTEREFLRELLGGCSTPISALAQVKEGTLFFEGNILSLDGKEKQEIKKQAPVDQANQLGLLAARELLTNGGDTILNSIRNGAK